LAQPLGQRDQETGVEMKANRTKQASVLFSRGEVTFQLIGEKAGQARMRLCWHSTECLEDRAS